MLRRTLLLAMLFIASAASHQAYAETSALTTTADLRFTDVSAGMAAPGAATSVNVAFHNYGPSPATDFQIKISLPPGTTYAGYAAQPLLKCAEPPFGSSGTITCTTPALNTNDGGSLDLAAIIDPTVIPGTVMTFPVTLTSSTALQPSQSASAQMTVAAPADLSISASAPSAVTAGGTLVTTLTVTNNGPADAVAPQVFVPQGGGAQVQQMAGPAGWDCSSLVGSCKRSTFAPGSATFTLTSVVPVTLSGSVTQKIEANCGNDPNFGNNVVFTKHRDQRVTRNDSQGRDHRYSRKLLCGRFRHLHRQGNE